METQTRRTPPSPGLYVRVFAVLLVITGTEVALSYSFGLFAEFTIAMLVIASAMKFALVVAFYMHLRYEPQMLSRFFAGGFALAAVLYAVVLASLGAAIFLLT